MKRMIRVLCISLIVLLAVLPMTAVFAAEQEPIGMQAAIERALAAAGLKQEDVTGVDKLESDLDDERPHYEIEFWVGPKNYEIEINAYTGSVQEKSVENEASPFSRYEIKPLKSVFDAILAEYGIDLSDVSLLIKADLDDDYLPAYEFEFRAGNKLYTVTCDALTGAITSYAEADVSGANGPVDGEKAKKIALDQSGLTEKQVYKLEIEYDNDPVPHYEVSFKMGGFEYEYEIDAATGAILKFEKERD